jgi:neuraminidase-like protein/ABC toxin-like protein
LLKQQRRLASDEAVYSELLMDPGVNPIVLTSRISNAMRTVQRFVQMVRLGQWSGQSRPAIARVDASQINPEWDVYLHSFRMTQANFEVLATPYFYMTPELRDDKTPPFKEVEALLRQSDFTPDAIEQAFLTYLERLGEVANLEICGTYLQEDDFTADEAFRFKSVLHVFGRTRGGVRRDYYYRRLNRYQQSQEWTPWEKVKIDIQAVEHDRADTRSNTAERRPEAGVHLLPLVWNRKLHIFWPSFVRKIEADSSQPGINLKDGTSKSDPPVPYWEVKLNWSSLDNGAWSPRQTSSDYHETMTTLVAAGMEDA